MSAPSRDLSSRLRRGAGRLRARLSTTPGEPPAPVAGEGRPPDAQLETTHLGPLVDEAVLRAKRRMRIGVDPDYDLLAENFDVLHYLLQSPELVNDPDVDLIRHFLENGEAEELSPHPDFSVSEYLRRHPKKAASRREQSPYLVWLKRGKDAGHLADPVPGVRRMARVLDLTPDQVVDLVVERRRSLRERFLAGTLGEMFARAVEIEPLIGASWSDVTRPKLLPLTKRPVVAEIECLHRAHDAAGQRRARVILVINRARWGGGRRMEGHIAHALANHVEPDQIVVVYTDDSTQGPPGRFPRGVREIDFADLSQRLSPEGAQHALVMLLRTFHADAIVNINSSTLSYAMKSYGRALSATERLFLCFFCHERKPLGNWDGWILRSFYRTFDYVAGVVTDSDHLARELSERYRVSGDSQRRLHVLRAPVDPELSVFTESPARDGRRPQVFWAGRWDHQKRVPLFLEIARQMPDVDFRMWGEPVMGASAPEIPPNVAIEGRYDHISAIPLDEADAWLYTSGWDGVPSQLLEVAMTGVPVVATLVGGTGEVITPDEAWPVAEDLGPDAYVAALRELLADPQRARRKALSLRERMLRDRTEKEFAISVAELLLDREPEETRS